MTSPQSAVPNAAVIADNLADVRRRVEAAEAAANRTRDSVTLIAVSKNQPEASVRAALAAGQRVFGENRVQEAQRSRPAMPTRSSACAAGSSRCPLSA
jgi:uncharacterized pyridoxal phosphate-containing UPF0001 family protein